MSSLPAPPLVPLSRLPCPLVCCGPFQSPLAPFRRGPFRFRPRALSAPLIPSLSCPWVRSSCAFLPSKLIATHNFMITMSCSLEMSPVPCFRLAGRCGEGRHGLTYGWGQIRERWGGDVSCCTSLIVSQYAGGAICIEAQACCATVCTDENVLSWRMVAIDSDEDASFSQARRRTGIIGSSTTASFTGV